MPIIGIDPSLVCTGYCYSGPDGQMYTGTIMPKKYRGSTRLEFIRGSIKGLMGAAEACWGYERTRLIVLEGYAMGGPAGKGSRCFDIGELGGMIKLLAYGMGIDVLLVPPSNLKKFGTGSGKAEKQDIVSEIEKSWGFRVPQHDEADAFVLHKLGEAYLDARKRRGYSSKRIEAIKGCSLIKGSE